MKQRLRFGSGTIGFICLIVTSAGWAVNWPLMKLLLRSWPPLFARGLSGVAAGIILAALAARRRQPLAVPRAALPRLILASFTNVFAWMGFGTMAMKFVSVGEGALVIYTMPIWAMLLAWPLSKAWPRFWDLAALMLAGAGLVLLFWGDDLSLNGNKFVGVGLALASAILFALGTILNGRPLPMPPLVAVAWQVGLGCAAMLVLGLVFEHPNVAAISTTGMACFVYMTAISMALCYLTWFETLRRMPAVTASTGLLLVPIFAMIAAAIILGEPFGPREIAAIVLTLSGVALALRKSRPKEAA